MKDTKTGAVICKKPDKEKGICYEPLLFITHIPHGVTDEELKGKINLDALITDRSSCPEIIFRADIHATSNEVQEEFEYLNPALPIPEIRFDLLETLV